MKKTILLMVVLTSLFLPSALALNCTHYDGDHRDLCNSVNPLDISDSDKLSLMQDGLYGQINPRDPSVNLQLEATNEPVITLKTVYDDKIVFIGRFVIFILFNYCLFSILTKSTFIRKWLIADY